MPDPSPITPATVRSLVGSIVPDLPESDDAELLFSGVIDSFTLMEVTDMFEQELKIQLAPADMKAENFASLAAMARLLSGKAAGNA